MLVIADLMKLGERRWALPVLATLADEGGGARFIFLLNRLGCARSALTGTLKFLQNVAWVERNTGHGHPLRPEYLLTAKGAEVARQAEAIKSASETLGLKPQSFQRWTLPLTFELRSSARRFTELKTELAPATSRALSLTLKQMIGHDLVSRSIIDDFPPAPLYDLTSRGWELAQAL
ncbi:MAG: winged helix-turn-helix transcriptional regulator [Parasphingopyxis sp.]